MRMLGLQDFKNETNDCLHPCHGDINVLHQHCTTSDKQPSIVLFSEFYQGFCYRGDDCNATFF